MAITDWPKNERPRERLLTHGAHTLSDAELLAIFLRIGIRGKSAVELARELLCRFSSLGRLFSASRDEIVAVPGLGCAKYAQLQAVIEMSRRALAEEVRKGRLLDSPKAVADYLRTSIGHLPHEVFIALWLDSSHRLLSCDELARGTLSQACVYPREVVKTALSRNAAAVIFAHNHPSGNGEPSKADCQLTKTLADTLALIEVRVLDHFIIPGGQNQAPVISLAERGHFYNEA